MTVEYGSTTFSEIIKPDQTKVLKCSACGKGLLRINHIFKKEDGHSLLYNLIVDCPYCGDKCFAEQIYGVFRYTEYPGVQLRNGVDESNNVMHFSTCKSK